MIQEVWRMTQYLGAGTLWLFVRSFIRCLIWEAGDVNSRVAWPLPAVAPWAGWTFPMRLRAVDVSVPAKTQGASAYNCLCGISLLWIDYMPAIEVSVHIQKEVTQTSALHLRVREFENIFYNRHIISPSENFASPCPQSCVPFESPLSLHLW